MRHRLAGQPQAELIRLGRRPVLLEQRTTCSSVYLLLRIRVAPLELVIPDDSHLDWPGSREAGQTHGGCL